MLHHTGDGAPFAALLLQLADFPQQLDRRSRDWDGWDDHEWQTATASVERGPRIRNVFTPDFLAEYVRLAKHRTVGVGIAVDTPSDWDTTLGVLHGRIVGLDVVALGPYQPEWFVMLRIEAAEPMASRDFARLFNSLARTHLPTYEQTPSIEIDLGTAADAEAIGKLTPHGLMRVLLERFTPQPIAKAFVDAGVVDSRGKVFAYAPHDERDVHTPRARQAALELAGGVHSISGMLLDGMVEAGQARTVSLHRNWSAVITLDGVGFVIDPEDGFARTNFRTLIIEAYWLAYADALADVASIDRYLRRPILDRRDRRGLLRELEDFSQLSRQWSTRGANTFPVPMSIRQGVEDLHGTDDRAQLAQRRSESISSGFLALANHRFNRILTLVAALTAGQVIRTLADGSEAFAPYALPTFVGFLAVLMLLLRSGLSVTVRVSVTALLALAALVPSLSDLIPVGIAALLTPGRLALALTTAAALSAAVSWLRHGN